MAGVGFLFAPKHHGAMKYTIGPRREMGVRTLFNLLGPLSNPAGPPNQLIGVFAKEWLVPLAQVLKKLGSRHVLVVNANDGLNEISVASATGVAELKDGQVATYAVTPEQLGLQRPNIAELAVDGTASSLAMVKSVLDNRAGPARDIVALNAGAAMYAADLVDSLAAGVEKAQRVIASGAAGISVKAYARFEYPYCQSVEGLYYPPAGERGGCRGGVPLRPGPLVRPAPAGGGGEAGPRLPPGGHGAVRA